MDISKPKAAYDKYFDLKLDYLNQIEELENKIGVLDQQMEEIADLLTIENGDL